jgi:hypothetical protein
VNDAHDGQRRDRDNREIAERRQRERQRAREQQDAPPHDVGQRACGELQGDARQRRRRDDQPDRGR